MPAVSLNFINSEMTVVAKLSREISIVNLIVLVLTLSLTNTKAIN